MSDETFGEIPQSDALAEASPESLAELLSRDPFGYSRQDRDKVVAALRAQRLQFAQAEAAEASGAKGAKPRQTKVSALLSKTTASAEDLGL